MEKIQVRIEALVTDHWPLVSVPADGGFVQVDVNLLGLQVFFDTPRAEFATEARLFVASPWRFDISWLHMVDPDDSGTQGLYSAHRTKNVAGPDGGGEAEGGIVGNLQCIFLAFDGDHVGDRAEDFFSGDAVTVVYIVEDRGLDVVAFGKLIGAATAGG